MRALNITVTVSDPKTNETLIVSGDLGVLRELISGVKISVPHQNRIEQSELVDQFIEQSDAWIDPLDPKCRTQAQDLYNNYVEWCEQANHRPMSSTRLAREWMRLGFERQIINGVRYWQGIKI